jgi:hypothetical protein
MLFRGELVERDAEEVPIRIVHLPEVQLESNSMPWPRKQGWRSDTPAFADAKLELLQ